MTGNFPELGRCISILDQLMKMYYDHGLADFEIGWGQQFYVEYIRVDKATLTKNIKKLAEIGYIEIVGDKKDKRVKHLYLTAKYQPESMAQNGGTPWKRMKANNSHHKREL